VTILWILIFSFFVERSSTIECYCQPPTPKLEMIASNLACFIKQTNFFLQRKMKQASHSAMSIDIYHLSKLGCCTNQTNIFI
jgi:hypothetical protein